MQTRSLIGMLALGLVAATSWSSWRTAHGADAPAPVYPPTMSDLMNTVIQPRHIKIWLAAQSGNWAYAKYELQNLHGALGRVADAVPTHHGMQVADMVEAFTKQHIADLDAAITAKRQVDFVKAYDALTDGCNSCHVAGGHSVVVIKQPAASDFPDQDFTPPHG